MRALLLIVTGVIYLALVLFDGLESPLFSLVFIGLASYEIVRLHRTHRKSVEAGLGTAGKSAVATPITEITS